MVKWSSASKPPLSVPRPDDEPIRAVGSSSAWRDYARPVAIVFLYQWLHEHSNLWEHVFFAERIPPKVLSVLASLTIVWGASALMEKFLVADQKIDAERKHGSKRQRVKSGLKRAARGVAKLARNDSISRNISRLRRESLGSLMDLVKRRSQKKRHIRFYPDQFQDHQFQLSTAPVEEDQEDEQVAGMPENAVEDEQGAGMTENAATVQDCSWSFNIDDDDEQFGDDDDEDEDDDDEDDDDDDDDDDEQFEDALLLPPATEEDDDNMIGDDMTELEPPKMASSSSASTSTEDSIVSTDSDVVQATSPTSSTLDGDSPIKEATTTRKVDLVAPLKKPPQKILKKSPSSIMYTNPAAKFGVAAELLRAKMDAKEFLEDPENTKEARRRWLGSFYAHAGISGTQKSNDTVPLSPPLVLATNFQIRSSGAWSDEDFFYSRISNPTRSALEETLATAEQGRRMDDGDSRCQAACFGSGMAAVSAVLGAAAGLMSSQQDRKVHAVVPKTCYDEAIKLLKMGSGGIASFIRVDMTNLEAVHKALAKHPDRGKVLYMETPDNPLTQVADLEKLVELARFHKAVTVVDTTWSPPVVGQVFRFQVDALCFSCTKTMGGHSDVLCGGVVANGATALGRQLFPRVRDWQICHGGVASPFDCFLVLRGLRTLPVRMERMCSTTLALATFLESHDSIEWVRYPGLESHPQHELAKRQMDLFGQILTFCIKGDSEAAMAFVGAVSLVRRATSTGGTETLVQHQRSVEQIKVTQGGVIRVSVGLENARDVIDDFSKALDCSKEVCATLGGPIRRNECIGGADEEFVAKDCDQVQVGAKQDRVIMSRVVSTV